MAGRLSQAVDGGILTIPQGELLVLNAGSESDLLRLDPKRSIVHARSASADAHWTANGWSNGAPRQTLSGAVLFLPRARNAQRASLKFARELTTGPIVIDGAKVDGIDAFYREVRSRAGVSDAWAKAHGKVFTVEGGEFSDWPDWGIRKDDDGFWRAPGVFSETGVDKASALLADALPALKGVVIDLGAGWGYLSKSVLESDLPTQVHLVEDDGLAIRAANSNISDKRAIFHWADALTWQIDGLADHVVSNPPFHQSRRPDPTLGQAFIRAAARLLKPKGHLWLVANRHLPYERTLRETFKDVRTLGETNQFKLFNATQPKKPRKG